MHYDYLLRACYGREVSHHNLPFGRDSGRAMGKLRSGKKEPLGEPRSEAVGVGKLWAGRIEARCSKGLVSVQIQLSLLGPQLEMWTKNIKLLSC